MDQETEKKYWREAYRRFQLIDWEPPVSQAVVEELRAALPPIQANEEVEAWLKRVLKTKFTPFTEIFHRAAASGTEEFPLPDAKDIQTQDNNLRLNFFSEAGQIVIKIEATGNASDQLKNWTLGLVDKNQPDRVIAVVELDDDGDGEAKLDNNLENRKALWDLLIGRLE